MISLNKTLLVFLFPILAISCSKQEPANSSANTPQQSSTLVSNCNTLECATEYYASHLEEAIDKLGQCDDQQMTSDIFCQAALATQQGLEHQANPIID